MRVALLAVLALSTSPVLYGQEVSDKEAKAALKEFRKEYRNPKERARLAAIDRILELKNKHVAKALVGVASKDSSPANRIVAIKGLVGQQQEIAQKSLLKVYSSIAVRCKEAAVQLALLEGLAKLEVAPKFKDLTRGFQERDPKSQAAVAKLVRFHRTMEAVKFLAPLVDLPQPANKDDPRNPPASYWEKKVKAWNVYFEEVLNSLIHLTGEGLASTKEVKDWMKSGGKVLSLEEGKKAFKDF